MLGRWNKVGRTWHETSVFGKERFQEIWMYIIDGKMLECAKRIESLNAKLLDH